MRNNINHGKPRTTTTILLYYRGWFHHTDDVRRNQILKVKRHTIIRQTLHHEWRGVDWTWAQLAEWDVENETWTRGQLEESVDNRTALRWDAGWTGHLHSFRNEKRKGEARGNHYKWDTKWIGHWDSCRYEIRNWLYTGTALLMKPISVSSLQKVVPVAQSAQVTFDRFISKT